MTGKDRERWDPRYAEREGELDPPSPFLVERVDQLIPGRLLDVACGDGANAIWLAERGFEVTAVDISPVALERLRSFVEEDRRALRVVELDLDDADALRSLGPFESIVVLRFKPERAHWDRLVEQLLPGGRLLLASFNMRHHHAVGPVCHWWLEPGELTNVHPELSLLRYEAEVGDGGVTDVYLFEKV